MKDAKISENIMALLKALLKASGKIRPPRLVGSKYAPHQGRKEMERRARRAK